MIDPVIKRNAGTSFPEMRQVEDYPVEDVFGDEVMQHDLYFIMKDGTIVLEQNLSEYAVKVLGALEKQAK